MELVDTANDGLDTVLSGLKSYVDITTQIAQTKNAQAQTNASVAIAETQNAAAVKIAQAQANAAVAKAQADAASALNLGNLRSGLSQGLASIGSSPYALPLAIGVAIVGVGALYLGTK